MYTWMSSKYKNLATRQKNWSKSAFKLSIKVLLCNFGFVTWSQHILWGIVDTITQNVQIQKTFVLPLNAPKMLLSFLRSHHNRFWELSYRSKKMFKPFFLHFIRNIVSRTLQASKMDSFVTILLTVFSH